MQRQLSMIIIKGIFFLVICEAYQGHMYLHVIFMFHNGYSAYIQ